MTEPVRVHSVEIAQLLGDENLRDWIQLQRWYASKSRSVTGTEIVESSDGGVTWPMKTALPKELKGVSALTWLEYDPVGDVVYVMKMGSELYQWMRKS